MAIRKHLEIKGCLPNPQQISPVYRNPQNETVDQHEQQLNSLLSQYI